MKPFGSIVWFKHFTLNWSFVLFFTLEYDSFTFWNSFFTWTFLHFQHCCGIESHYILVPYQVLWILKLVESKIASLCRRIISGDPIYISRHVWRSSQILSPFSSIKIVFQKTFPVSTLFGTVLFVSQIEPIDDSLLKILSSFSADVRNRKCGTEISVPSSQFSNIGSKHFSYFLVHFILFGALP